MANEFKVKKGLIVHGSGSTVLDIQGSQGQLFSITDDLTGTLFAVSDISGVPIFDVNADGTTTLDGNLTQTSGSATFGNGITLQQTAGNSLIESSTSSMFIKASNIQIQGNLIPDADSSRNLGASNRYWENLYADNLYGDGSNLTNVTGIVPSNMVTTDTTQSITGAKTLSSLTLSNQNPAITLIDSSGSTYTAQWRFKDNKLQYLWGGGIKAYFTTDGLAIGDQDSSNDAQIVKTGSSPYGLAIKTNNIQALNVDSSQNATFAGDITLGANHIGRDDDNYVGFETDNQIKFRVNGATQIKLIDGALNPQTDSDIDLGTNTVRYRNIYADNLYGDGSSLTNVTATSFTETDTLDSVTGRGATTTNNISVGSVTIGHSAFTAISLTRNSTNGSNIDFNNSGGVLGRIGFLGDGTLAVTNSTIGTSNIFSVSASGFANFASTVKSTSGVLALGADVTLFRDGANILRTDDTFHANSNIHVGGAGKIYDRANNANYIELADTVNISTDTSISGDLTVTGKVIAQEFHTTFVSASIIYDSGSTKFGDSFDDTHDFTGSINLTGNDANLLHLKTTTANVGNIKIESTHISRVRMQSGPSTGEIFMDGVGGAISGGGYMFNTPTARSTYHFMVNNTPEMSLVAGSLGVGTGYLHNATPKDKLDISGSITIRDIGSTRGIRRDNDAYDLRMMGGTSLTDGAYISLSGDIRGGVGNAVAGKVEIAQGGAAYSTRSAISSSMAFNAVSNAGTTTDMVIEGATGNVGIGTTSPSATFVVQPSETTFNLAGLANGQIALGNNTSSGKAPTIGSRTTNTGQPPLQFITGQPDTSTVPGMIFSVREDNNSDFGTTANKPAYDFTRYTTSLLRITRDGKVGIGTTSPAVRLDFGSATGKAFHLYTSGTDYYGFNMLQYDSGPFSTNIFAGNGGEIKLRTASGTSTQSTRLTVTAGGNVGIGETNPSRSLHIATDTGVLIKGKTGSVNAKLSFLPASGGRQYDFSNSGSDFRIFDASANVTRMHFDNDGNTGINTTNPSNKLQVAGAINALGFVNEEGGNKNRLLFPKGGSYNGGNPITGAIKVTLPTSWTNTMLTITVRVFDYSTGESFDLTVAGYTYTGGPNWVNTSAWLSSQSNIDKNFTVRFGHDGTKCCFYIGELTSTWSYLKVNVIDATLNHSSTVPDWSTTAWAVGVESTAFLNVTRTHTDTQTNNWARNGQDVYYASGTGNVGIGITSPTAKLHVVGDGIVSGNLTFKPKAYSSTDDLNNDNRTIFSTHQVNNTTSNRATVYSSIYTLGGGVSNALQISTNEDYNESGMFIRQYNQNGASPQGTGWQNWTEVWTTNHAPLSKITNWDTAYTYSQAGHLPLAGGTITGNLNLTYAYPRINLTDTNNDSDYSIINNDGTFSIYDVTNTSHRLSISAAGTATFSGDVAISSTMPKLTFTDLQQDDWRIMNDNGDFRFTNIDGSGHALVFAANNNATFAGSVSVGNDLTATGDLTVRDITAGSYTRAAQTTVSILSDAQQNSILKFREDTDTYGFTFGYYGSPNNFAITRHNNSATGDTVISIPRDSNNVTFTGNINMAANATVDGVDISALPTTFAPTTAEQNVQSDWNATSGDAFILNKPTTFAPSAHNHTSLTGVTNLTFAAQSSDAASITTTIDGTHTYFDFNLTDDNNNDWWRWRFTPSGDTVYDAMVLKPVSNGNANLVVSGNITADNIPTSYAPVNAEQNVQADWNATSGDALILNKPTIPTAITDYVSAANGGTFADSINVHGNILLTGAATTTNQSRTIDFTGFDKEGTTDPSDRAYIRHTVNTGGHAGSVLEISSQNDVGDGIAFSTHASSLLRHNGNAIFSTGHKPTFAEIETTPTTLAGYGITDAAPSTVVNQSDFVSAANGGTFSGNIDLNASFKWAKNQANSYTYSAADSTGMYIERLSTAGAGSTLADMRFQARNNNSGTYTSLRIKGSDSTVVITAPNTNISGNVNIGVNKYNLTVNAPTSLTTSVVNDTINVTFTASTTTNIDNYLIFSSVAGGDYGLISVIPPADFGATMSIIDDSFNAGGTQAYRVYAVKNGVYSSPLTGSQTFTVGTVEPTNLSVINLNTAYYIQYDAPSVKGRFVASYNIYKHEHATASSLDRASASLVYSGINNSYMYGISGVDNNNFHQFWVEVTTT